MCTINIINLLFLSTLEATTKTKLTDKIQQTRGNLAGWWTDTLGLTSGVQLMPLIDTQDRL